MEMENQENSGICPKCGMPLQDGVCQSCGYSQADQTEEALEANGMGRTGEDQLTETDHNSAYQQNETDQSGFQQNVTDQNFYYQQSGADQNGYYQQNTEGQNGYYQQSTTGQNGYYQQNGADQNGYYQQNTAGQNGYYQQNGAGQNGYYQQNGAGQNGYYQQGGAGGYYQNMQGANGYNGYNPNQPSQKKGNKGAVIAAIIGAVLLLGLVIALIVVVSMGIKNNLKDDRDYPDSVERDIDDNDNENSYDYDDIFNDLDDDDSNVYDEGDSGAAYDDDDYDPLEFLDDVDWDDESWKEEPVNYEPDEVGDEYYFELCNCIDRTTSYNLKFETYEDTDESQDICMRVNYYQLDGDIPNLDQLNEALKESAVYYCEYYYDNISDYEEIFEEYGNGYVVEVESFVTYNDEERISIVMNEYYESPVEVNKHVTALNIDLETGIIVYNTDFFDISDDFLEYYRSVCKDQNGSVPALRYFDNDELREFFEDENDLILYYTPCGFEVGINYETEDSYGWVTATLNDECEQYLQSY